MNPRFSAIVLAAALAHAARADDWILGAVDPDERVVVDADRTVDGRIILMNRSVLTIRGATLSVRGEIYALDESALVGEGGAIRFQQDFAQQYGLLALDDASIDLAGTRFLDAGLGHTALVAGRGRIALDGVEIVDGFCTWVMEEDGAIELDRCTIAGEFVPFGRGSVRVSDSSTVLVWVVVPDGGVVDVALPPPGEVAGFSIGPDSPWASGIPYELALERCTGVVWGSIARSGSSVTYRDSTLIAVGSAFEHDEAVEIKGLANLARFDDSAFAWGDVAVRFVRSSVDAWNFYAFGGSSIRLEACVFGELQAGEDSRATLVGSLCDGRGGFVQASGRAQLLMVSSTNLSQTVARDSGTILAVESALFGAHTVVQDESTLVLANSFTRAEPLAIEAATVFDLSLDAARGEVGDEIPLRGTARLLSGPGSPIAFDHARLDAAPADDAESWTPIARIEAPVREGVLGTWRTRAFNPGSYVLRLGLWHNFGDSISVTATGTLDGACAADFDGDGTLTIFDFLAFQTAFGGEDADADLAPPWGTLDVFDFLAFLSAFGGC